MAAGPGSNHLDRSTADHPVGDEAGRDDEEKPAAALATGHPDVARSLDPGGAVRDAVTRFGITKPDDPAWPGFEHRLSFGMAEPGNTSELQAAVQRAEKEIGCSPRRLFDLAIPPAAFASIVGMLGDSGLAKGASRVITEKPFGTDLKSARVLNRELHAVFDESQVFRVDHSTWSAGSTRATARNRAWRPIRRPIP
jgi:hypothetical protein